MGSNELQATAAYHDLLLAYEPLTRHSKVVQLEILGFLIYSSQFFQTILYNEAADQ